MRALPCRLSAVIFLFACGFANAAPGDTIYAEDFQDGGLHGWSQAGGDGGLGVGEYAPGSGEFALTSCCGDTVVFSPVIDTAFAGAQLSLRVQRGGAAAGSDRPESNEYLDVYFLDRNGNWQFAARYPGGGAAGETINDSFTLSGDLLHAGFRVRLDQRNGNANADHWHLHEIGIIEAGASGSIGSLCDDFSSGLARWTVNDFGGSGNAAPTTQTANSAAASLAIFDGSVRLQSLPLDLADAASATLNLWVRRGADGFSEDPDGGEDLAIGFLDAGGNFQGLQTLPGNGTPGEAFLLAFPLPAAALHDAFRVRLERFGNGAGGYWHVDDVCVDIERSIDHFAIRHDGSGVNCQAEPVELVAHDINHFVVGNYTGTASLSTSTGNGDWRVFAGNGAVTNPGNGTGSYTFVPADRGRVVLGLRDTFIETVNIDAVQGTMQEDPQEDASLAFGETGFNLLVDGAPGLIATQIAGKPGNLAPGASAIELQAIRTSDETGACEAAFTGSVNVDFAMTCELPASCSGANLSVNGTAIAANDAGAPAVFTTLALDFGDAGDSTAPLVLRYDDAGQVRLHARHALSPSGEIMQGASNAFVVKPFGFDVSAAGNPAATAPTDSAYRHAGEHFTVTVRAVGWQAVDDANADGEPDGHANNDPADNADLSDNIALPSFAQEPSADTVRLSSQLWLPVAGSDPGLGGTTSIDTFSLGAGNATARFDEVGIIGITARLEDDDYLGTGPVDGRSNAVGRFTPAWFSSSVDGHGCNDAEGFSYSGQPLAILSVSAHAASGDIVRNFAGITGFAKDVMLAETTGAAGGVANGGIAAMDFIDGTATILAAPSGVAFAFDVKESAPATIVLRATDSDGTSSAGHAEAQTEIRSARFVMDDANAMLLTPAIAALRVETFDGTAWTPETADTCTGIDPAAFSLSAYTGNLAPGDTLVDADPVSTFLLNGLGRVTLSAPGAGNNGSVVVAYDMPAWLAYDWNGEGARDDEALVTFFDVFHAEPGLIQRVEIVP